jgi:hypothetical protein
MKSNRVKFIVSKVSPPDRAALIYVVLAVLWIGCSNHALATVVANPLHLLVAITLKDLMLVMGSGLAIFWMIRGSHQRLTANNQHLRRVHEHAITRLLSTMQMSPLGRTDEVARVPDMAEGLARLVGLQGDTLHDLRVGALLRDIAHLAIPKAHAETKVRLSPKDMASMRQHPQIGLGLLEQAGLSATVLNIVHAHHERWDGFGYPLGLVGEAIPLAARIVSIVDVWNALGSDRGYRAGWPEPEVLAYLKHGAGTQFDPDLTALFLAHYEQLKATLVHPDVVVAATDLPAADIVAAEVHWSNLQREPCHG